MKKLRFGILSSKLASAPNKYDELAAFQHKGEVHKLYFKGMVGNYAEVETFEQGLTDIDGVKYDLSEIYGVEANIGVLDQKVHNNIANAFPERCKYENENGNLVKRTNRELFQYFELDSKAVIVFGYRDEFNNIVSFESAQLLEIVVGIMGHAAILDKEQIREKLSDGNNEE